MTKHILPLLLVLGRWKRRVFPWRLPSPVGRWWAGSVLSEQRQRSFPQWSRGAIPYASSPEVRVGIVGAGRYARLHLDVLTQLPGVRVTSILTTGGPSVEEVAPRYGIEARFTDIEEFIARGEVDCYLVVASAHRVASVAIRCLETGKPVFMEKPAGLSAAETQRIADAANGNGTWGMVGMNRRFYSVVEHGLAALADCGPIRGAVLEVPEPISAVRSRGDRTEEEYLGWMFRNSVHGIDLLRYVVGDVANVHSVANPNVDARQAAASFGAVVEHKNGALSTVLALWDTPSDVHLKVIAEQGWLDLVPLEEGWFHGRGAPIRIPQDDVDVRFRPGLYAQDSAFIDAVRRGEPPTLPACLLADAVQTNQLIERILADTARTAAALGDGSEDA